jgi:hypothetical protein
MSKGKGEIEEEANRREGIRKLWTTFDTMLFQFIILHSNSANPIRLPTWLSLFARVNRADQVFVVAS